MGRDYRARTGAVKDAIRRTRVRVERADDGRMFNTYVVAMPDGRVASHRKLHCFISEHLSSGDEYTVFDLPGGQRVGVLICYDNNIGENVRINALMGAEILLAPHQTGGCHTPSPHCMGRIDPALWEARETNPAAIEAELAAQYQAEQDASELQRIGALIKQKVERNWDTRPPGTDDLKCTVNVRLGATGSVLLVRVIESSGNPAFDRSVEAAVLKADPLPMPESERLRAKFSGGLDFIFSPNN